MTEADGVSVVVPVYNDSERLSLCLEALRKQVSIDVPYEVLVVDNGSTPPASERLGHEFPEVRFIDEAEPGSYAARNAGVAEASYGLLAFTDADCLPEPNWLAAGLAGARATYPRVYLGGPVEVFARDPQRPTWAERFEQVFEFDQAACIHNENYSVTANMWTSRAVFDEVGGFETRVLSGGDHRFGQVCFAAGIQAEFVNDLVVRHPARRRLQDLIQKRRRTTAGMFMQRDTPAGRRLRSAKTRQGRLAGAWLTLSNQLLPKPKLIRQVARLPRDRMPVGCVVALLHYVGVAEKVRLKLGGRARRT